MENREESKKPYVEPSFEKCENLVEITQGVVKPVSGKV